MGKFGALLRILKRSYDVSHEKLGWAAMNFGGNRELYFATFLRFGLSQNSNFPGRRPAFRRSSIVGFSACQFFFFLLSSFSDGEGAAAAHPEAQDQFELEQMSKPSNVMRNLPGTSRIESKIKS